MVIWPLSSPPDVAVGLPGAAGAVLSEETSPTWLWLLWAVVAPALALIST